MDILKVKVNDQWVGIPALGGHRVYIKYSASQPTQDSDMKDSPDEWMGIYAGVNATAPEHYTDYAWYKIKGAQGIQGNPFTYSDFTPEQLEGLRGPQGIQGIQGIQGVQGNPGKDFNIAKVFSSISAMESYTGSDIEPGDFAIISTVNVNDVDNGKLYRYNNVNIPIANGSTVNAKQNCIYWFTGTVTWGGSTGSWLAFTETESDSSSTIYSGDVIPNPTQGTVTDELMTHVTANNAATLQINVPTGVTVTNLALVEKWEYICDLSGPSDLPAVTSSDNGKVLQVSGGEWSVEDPLSAKANKASPVFTGSISLGRKNNTTVGSNSCATGTDVTASASDAHAEGYSAVASGQQSHAEGWMSTASGNSSHAEGGGAIASGNYAHAEGSAAVASGNYSHAEGNGTVASGSYAHAEGSFTKATHRSQHTSGENNVLDPSQEQATNRGTYIEIVGNGTTNNARSNARALDWNGNEYLKGDLYVNCNADSTGGTKITPLPSVSSSDDGKFLRVVNGAWAAVSLANANGVSF